MWPKDRSKNSQTFRRLLHWGQRNSAFVGIFYLGILGVLFRHAQAHENTMKNVWNLVWKIVESSAKMLWICFHFCFSPPSCIYQYFLLYQTCDFKRKEGGHVYMVRDLSWQSDSCRLHLPSIIKGVAYSTQLDSQVSTIATQATAYFSVEMGGIMISLQN